MTTRTQGPETRALAALFRAKRGMLQMSQMTLAELTGISQISLSRKLKGTSPITIYEASLICRALDLNFSDTLASAIDMAEVNDEGDE